VVDSLGDTGSGSAGAGDLRYCITRADTLGKADAAPETITFAVQGVINLGGALPDLSTDMDILGPGAAELIVRRSTGGNYRIFTVGAGAQVHVSGLTATNGYLSKGDGGGISNKGTLALMGTRIIGNYAQRVGSGGLGDLTQAFGGGIYNEGSLLVQNSAVVENSLYAFDYFGESYGGGIFTSGPLSIVNCTISGNVVHADDFNDNPTPFAFGGGIHVASTAVTVTVDDSTIADNTLKGVVTGGSGVSVYSSMTKVPSVAITHSTVALNVHGSGILTGKNLTLRDSIVAHHGSYPDVDGVIASSGFNLISKSAGGSGYLPSDLLDVDPLLGPLQNNGGPTQTMALLPSSPAIDSGTNQMAPEWDQRGPGYPRIVNGTIDRGAFEVQNTAGPRERATAPIRAPAANPPPEPVPALRGNRPADLGRLDLAAARRRVAPPVSRAVHVATAAAEPAADLWALAWR
jgi:hypothetical protein